MEVILSKVIWLTGLSGSGKTTIALELNKKLKELFYKSYILDGDEIRKGLSSDLGFSLADRKENIRRVSEVCKILLNNITIPIVSFISPIEEDRKLARNIIGSSFLEVYVKCKLEVCEQRDVKGLYAKARRGEIKNFTGIDSPYEEPLNADVVIDTEHLTVSECVLRIIEKGF